jgi:plasmid stabilization system protein ParE
MIASLHQEANLELRHSTDYYGTLNPQLADRFLETIKAVIALATESPLRFPLVEDNVRRVLAPVFPYATLYSVKENRIRILAIMHCARKPGYWKKRI